MLNRKFLTKLLDKDFRKRILTEGKRAIDNTDLHISDYARYICDSQIISRNKDYAECKESYYGFLPINAICYVDNDDNVIKNMFEFKTINHFLKDQDGDNAVEVATCIILQLYNDIKKQIKSFNPSIIDEELKRIEDEYVENQKKLKEEVDRKNEVLASINNDFKEYADSDKYSTDSMKDSLSDILNRYKTDGKISDFIVKYDNKTDIFAKISLKFDENDDFIQFDFVNTRQEESHKEDRNGH